MFCEYCGNKFDISHKFCIKCGRPNNSTENKRSVIQRGAVVTSDKWWQRLLKVAYIFLCLQILWIVPLVWSVNSTDSSYYGGQFYYTDTYKEAFWYSILAIVIFMGVTRLIKITVLYIVMGQNPEWKKEFKKFF